ncbi:BnaC09g39070D [Brassica napus]|uniref:BnaC09g39070D protein n=1 Tax=Brassica napus TaxID=3708 RepID=A0A078FLY4_BRANA|nr:BnaC09g39070D [Brassica napus]
MSNKDEALRAKGLAEDWMSKSDFPTARRVAVKAQKMDETLENIAHMIMVCDVHCAAQEKSGDETDWYKILQVEYNADDNAIKKQYRKFALHLHPDKNKLPGAEAAFKMIGEAQRVLLDKDKRRVHDMKRKPFKRHAPGVPSYQQHAPPPRPFYTAPSKAPAQEAAAHKQQPESSVRVAPRKEASKAKSSGSSAEHINGNGKRKKIVESDDSEGSFECEEVAATGGQRSGRGSRASSGMASDMEILQCADPDFTNFDKLREESCFKAGQIWAMYDDKDKMPRYYANIRKVIRKPNFTLKITWLEHKPDDERAKGWARGKLPVSVGKYQLVGDDNASETPSFSHLISPTVRGSKDIVCVYPMMGETWALFKNWDINWPSSVTSLKKCAYEVVEVLDDDESHIEVMMLERVEGFTSVFKEKVEGGVDVRKTIPRCELLRFSHYVPAFRLTGERGGAVRGYVELDCTALSRNLLRS